MEREKVARVLVYRLGSIGDFVIALPCLHLLRRRFRDAEIALLTNWPVEARAAPASELLSGAGLVDRYLSYPTHTRDPRQLASVARAVRSFRPDLLAYLAEPRGLPAICRDYVFFRCCGIRRAVGFPFTLALRHCRPLAGEEGLHEREAERLARCLAPLGAAEPTRLENWDLGLSAAEQAEADRLLGEAGNRRDLRSFIGLSTGTKQPINDWGDANWSQVLDALRRPERGLVLIGATADRARLERLAGAWPGPVVNACGRLSPRLSAALIKRLALFLCHDSGPMHLAATVGTRCVAVFSKRNPPGEWYPFGDGHKILYPPREARSIEAIAPSQVIAAAEEILDDGRRAKTA